MSIQYCTPISTWCTNYFISGHWKNYKSYKYPTLPWTEMVIYEWYMSDPFYWGCCPLFGAGVLKEFSRNSDRLLRVVDFSLSDWQVLLGNIQTYFFLHSQKQKLAQMSFVSFSTILYKQLPHRFVEQRRHRSARTSVLCLIGHGYIFIPWLRFHSLHPEHFKMCLSVCMVLQECVT